MIVFLVTGHFFNQWLSISEPMLMNTWKRLDDRIIVQNHALATYFSETVRLIAVDLLNFY